MKRNLGYFLLTVIILTGCSDSTNEVEANQVEHADETSSEQKKLVEEYKGNIDDNSMMILFKDFYKRFVEGESEIEINNEIRDVYNQAVKKEIDSGVERYYDSKSWISEKFISNENKEYLTLKEEEYEEEIENIYVSFIDNFFENNIDTTEIEKINPYGYSSNIEELTNMRAFIDALLYPDSETMIKNLLETVNPHYSGEKGYEIKKFIRSKEISLESWINAYNNANGTKLTEEAGVVEYKAMLGMTAEEVENSTLGKPQSINRTVTEYSLREQWVYGNGIYLYFEDGILTGFQD